MYIFSREDLRILFKVVYDPLFKHKTIKALYKASLRDILPIITFKEDGETGKKILVTRAYVSALYIPEEILSISVVNIICFLNSKGYFFGCKNWRNKDVFKVNFIKQKNALDITQRQKYIYGLEDEKMFISKHLIIREFIIRSLFCMDIIKDLRVWMEK